MSSKPRKPGTKDGRGGCRKGAGRPPNVSISRYQVDKMLATAEVLPKDNEGKKFDDVLLSAIYG